MKRIFNQKAYTLIELLTVIAIIAILISLATSTYQRQFNLAKKTGECKTFAREIADKQFRYYSQFSHFTTILGFNKKGSGLSIIDGDESLSGTQSQRAYCTARVEHINNDTTTFLITMIPNGWEDPECGDLTLDNAGREGTTRDEDNVINCWNR